LSDTGAPILVAPSLNWTVPEGVPPGDVTVAVNVTFCPKLEGLTDDVSETIELALAMVKLLSTAAAAL
jgi:hypothetical protein